MELTGIAVLDRTGTAAGAVCVFIYAVKKDHFRDIEEAKYQVFWSFIGSKRLLEGGWQAKAPAPQEPTKVGQTLSSVNPGGRTVAYSAQFSPRLPWYCPAFP
jgi:hypothetical protein